MNSKCPACNSDHTVRGTLRNTDGAAGFYLGEIREKAFWTDYPSVPVAAVGTACLDCGLVWTTTDVDKARKMVARDGSESLKKAFKMTDQSEPSG